MSNSAITFNTAGLASTTSPGLVGTGAQTFAGKKTLEGGALIKGDTSAGAIAAGYVGEIKTATSGAVSATASTWTNVASILVPQGIWSMSGVVTLNGGAAPLGFLIALSQYSGATGNDHVLGENWVGGARDTVQGGSASIPSFIANFTGSDRTYYIKVNSDSSLTARGRITAIRIA